MTSASPSSNPSPRPPLDSEAARLHDCVVGFFRQQRSQAETTIRGWHAMAEIRRTEAFRLFGSDDFFSYCREQHALTSRPYIVRCLPIGALPLALFKDCTVPAEALQQATHFGPLALRALAEATRGRVDGSGKRIIAACDLVVQIQDDQEAAWRLHGILVLGEALTAPRPDGEPQGEKEEDEEPTANELARKISEQLADTQTLALELELRVEAEDRIAPKLKARLRAQVLGMEGLLPTLSGLAARGLPGRPGRDRRRQGRAATWSQPAAPTAPVDAVPPSAETAQAAEAHGDEVHGDEAHGDEAFMEDEAAQAADEAHADEAHADEAFMEDEAAQAAGEVHADEAAHAAGEVHADEAAHAADEAHADKAHADEAHADKAHADKAHADKAHADKAQAADEAPITEPLTSPGAPAAEPPSSPAPPSALVSRRRPDLWRRGDRALPVPFPSYVLPHSPPPSTMDRLAACVIALGHAATAAAVRLTQLRSGAAHQPVDLVLAGRFYTAVRETADYKRVVAEVLGPAARRGQSLLEPAYRRAAAATSPMERPLTPAAARTFAQRLAARDPAVPVPSLTDDPDGWARVFPIAPHPAWACDAPAFFPTPADPPLWDWVVAACGDFLGLPSDAPLDTAPPMFHFIGALNALNPLLTSLVQAIDSEGDGTLDPRLAVQALASMAELAFRATTAGHKVRKEAQQGYEEETRRRAARAAQKAESDARIVVLGESRRPALYTKIGLDASGHLLAVTAETPQLMVIVGNTGYGKSHLMHLLAEGVYLNLSGINSLAAPQRTARFEVDYNRGATRRQMLSGFQPNLEPTQLELLQRHYDYRADGNEAYTRGTLYCLPDSVRRLTAELAPLVERGLRIKPARCGPGDLTMAGYRSLLGNARGVSGGDRPKYMETIETLITQAGAEATPQKIHAAVESSGINANIRKGMLAQLQLLFDLVTPAERLNDAFLEPEPVFVLLESSLMSPDFLLPYQSIIASALCRPLRDGRHPHRWVFIDEYNKFSTNAVVTERSREAGQERRHHPVTFVVNGQRITGMDRAFVGQATIFVSFRTTSHKEIRALKDCCGALDAVPDELFTTLQHGECIVAALQTTGAHEVYLIKTRPAVSHAGGETLRVTGSEE